MSWTYSRQIAGVGLEVEGEHPELLERLTFDFSGFEGGQDAPSATVRWRVLVEALVPPPGLLQSFRGRYGVCFDRGSVRYIWYPGPVWVIYDFATNRGEIWGEDLETLYERLYLSLLSRVGELLEVRGLHRIHGLALTSEQHGICLFLMRSGVGKSSLAYALLQRPGWALLSEDTPLLDRRGQLRPFPFRLALRESHGEEPKRLLRASDFPLDREGGGCLHLFAGAWTTGEQPAIRPLRRAAQAGLVFRDGVLGLGVPQVVELFLRPGLGEALAKARLLLGRLAATTPLLRRPAHTFYLTPDAESNADFLEGWLERSAASLRGRKSEG